MSEHKNIGQFEEAWRDAFEGSRLDPPAHVWDKVEVNIANKESGSLKRGLLMFKLLAAASVVFAIGISTVGYFYLRDSWTDTSGGITENSNQSSIPEAIEGQQDNINKDIPDVPGKDPVEQSNELEPVVPLVQSDSGNERVGDEIMADNQNETDQPMQLIGDDPEAEKGPVRMNPESLIGIDQMDFLEGLALTLDPGEFGKPEIRNVAHFDFFNRPNTEEIWAGVNMSAGAFTPNRGSALSGFSSVTAEADYNRPRLSTDGSSPYPYSSESAGVSYSVGLGMGTNLSRKWLLQGGLSYMYYNTSVMTNAVEPASGTVNWRSDTQFSASNDLANLKNSYEFISVPVQAGYYLVNRKFSWTVTSGLSADFLVQNQITDSQGIYETQVNYADESSAYKTTYFNVLLGTELGYTIDRRYRLSVNPGLRHGVTSYLKPEYNGNDLPYSFHVGFRFNYIFD